MPAAPRGPTVDGVVNADTLPAPLRMLRGCVHLLVAALLVLAAGRAMTGQRFSAIAVVAVAVVLAGIYTAAAVVPAVRRSGRVAEIWLGLLTVAWAALLGLTPDAVWLACSHGDVIKAIVADALGLHLDQFQRIVVDPASISVVSYTDTRPFVVRVNDTGGDVSGLVPPKRRRARRRQSSDAVVGGGAGPGR